MSLPAAAAAIRHPSMFWSKHIFELTDAHGAMPVLGLITVIPLLLVALLNIKPLNGLGLGGDDGPAGVEKRHGDQLQQDLEPTRLPLGYIVNYL